MVVFVLAAPVGCSFDATGLGQSGEGGQGGSETSTSAGSTTGLDSTGTTAGPTAGSGSGESGGSETGGSLGTGGTDSSGAVEPGTTTSSTGDTSTTGGTTTGGGESTGGDGTSSGGCTEQVFYEDKDGDGYGDSSKSVMACEAPAGHVAMGEDCDDGDDAVSPGTDEVCDGKDNDCDERKDEFNPGTNLECEGCKMALYDNRVYHFCDTIERWDDARQACEARDAALVKDDDDAEHAWLVNQLPLDSGPWYIGGRAPNNDDKFVWLDGAAVSNMDLRWGLARPLAGGNTSYMTLVSDGNLGYWITYNGRWYDRAMSEEEPYICEDPPA